MKTLSSFYCLAALLALALPARAGIQLNGTRVIYPAGKKEVTLGLTNKDIAPRLIQAWVDGGDNEVNLQQGIGTFIVTPPIFRLDAGKGQTLRIIYTGQPLPQDRESVFWLNVLEVPPKQAKSNVMKVSIRTRLKLFYRPGNLPGTPQGAVSNLRWRLTPDGKSAIVECENPTPWNISFNSIRLKNTSADNAERLSGMCPAKGSQKFLLTGYLDNANRQLLLTTVDDFGGYHNIEAMTIAE